MAGRAQCGACRVGLAAGAARCPWVAAPKQAGARLYRCGAGADAAYFVLEGEVLLVREAPGGTWPRALRGAGSLVGLEALRGGPYLDDAICTADTRVCALPRSRVESFLALGPSAAKVVAQLALEEAERVSSERAPAPCATRLARFLLARHAQGRRVGLSKGTIAALLQMRPETLSRCLRRLARDGGIDPRTLEVRDVRVLARA